MSQKGFRDDEIKILSSIRKMITGHTDEHIEMIQSKNRNIYNSDGSINKRACSKCNNYRMTKVGCRLRCNGCGYQIKRYLRI